MIFVDSSALIGLADKDDRFHLQGVDFQAKNKTQLFVATNLVVIETLGWIRYKLGKTVAVQMGQNLLSGEGIRIVRVTTEMEQVAWGLFRKLDGRGISMIDCTSFVAMKRLKIQKVFTFDRDFAKAGLTVVP